MSQSRIKHWLGFLVWMTLTGYVQSGLAIELDATFGQEGLVTTRVGYYEDMGQAVAVQPDEKIVVAGSSSNNVNLDLAVVRYNPDGSLDLDFNGNGQVVVAVGNGDDLALDVALQQDGKIVVCGRTFTGSDDDIVLLRLLDDGTSDPDFGINGIVTLPLGTDDDSASAVAIQDDGRILVAGTTTENGQQSGVVVRFLANGFVDPSFGTRGMVKIASGDASTVADLALQSDQGIVVTGFYEQSGQTALFVTRLLTNGVVDSAFGKNGGVQIVDSMGSIQGNSLVVQPDDGAVLVAGTAGKEGSRDIVVLRLTAAGLRDTSFGENGLLRYGTAESDDVAYDVLVDEETLFVSGFTTESGKRELVLLECPTAGGEAALSVVQVQQGQIVSEGRALALQADAKIVAAGLSEESEISSIILARYATSDSTAEKSTGTSKEESVYILTVPPAEITRVGCMTGGEILEGSDLNFTARGVVYSIAPYPSLPTEDAVTTEEDSSDTTDTTDTTDDDAAKGGYTSNGKGVGRFGTVLSELDPGTVYYVRAYGVTEDDEVLYGNQFLFTTEDSCFIATAAYGSLLHPHVQVLRQFRDRYLLKSTTGRLFVHYYYMYSPSLADWIADSSVVRFVVRLTLLPVIAGGYIALHWGMAGIVLAMISVAGGGMVVRRWMQHLWSARQA